VILKNKQLKLSIIIPTLNESEQIEYCLNGLQLLRQQGHEIIVVDGGSNDNTVSLALPFCDRVMQSKKSRAIQMNSGAAEATGDCILFLHADTILPSKIIDLFLPLQNIEKKWGRFDIRLSGRDGLFRVIETCMNIRSRITGIATGDQVVFVGKELFDEINGFPEIALMEDIAISRLLLKRSKPVCFREIVISSSRRWEENGIIKTILKMWAIRLLYFFYVDTNRLDKIYS
jgi:rSAM/selenodomain-associated transferase 2